VQGRSNSMNSGYQHTHVPPALAAEFIDTFSRMEYAMKNGGFAHGNGAVTAAWDAFANAIDGTFQAVNSAEFQAAVTFLLSEPARKQTHNNGILGFGPLFLDPKQTKAQRTLLVVRTVRNNLEHGGKIQPEGEKEKGRNERLVVAALTVLRHAADLHKDVRAKFLSSGSA
jgi:hypothetical protein